MAGTLSVSEVQTYPLSAERWAAIKAAAVAEQAATQGPRPVRVRRPAISVRAATKAAYGTGNAQLLAPHYATTDKSGWCKAPIVIDQEGEGHWRLGPDGQRVREPARTLSQLVRCRKCDGCRKERRCMWANRAVSEWKRSTVQGGRTWFGTLTFRPEEHYRLKCMTEQRLRAEGIDPAKLSWSERYAEELREYHGEVDRFLARLRKGLAKRGWQKARFRYLMVPEPHVSGNIHYHVLLHEVAFVDKRRGVDEVRRITNDRLEEAWKRHGFSAWRLVRAEDQVRYVTKYLGKHHYEGRIRASEGYGADVHKRVVLPPGGPDLRDWLWQRERDPLAEQTADVLDLRQAEAAGGAKASELYGAEGDDDETAALKLPWVPVTTPNAKRYPAPPAGFDTPALRHAAQMTANDADGEEVKVGEYLGTCPSGLHVGTGCGCEPQEDGLACLPESDEYRGGVPRRKWPLRGWHEPSPGRGAPGVPRPYKRKDAGAEH